MYLPLTQPTGHSGVLTEPSPYNQSNLISQFALIHIFNYLTILTVILVKFLKTVYMLKAQLAMLPSLFALKTDGKQNNVKYSLIARVKAFHSPLGVYVYLAYSMAV